MAAYRVRMRLGEFADGYRGIWYSNQPIPGPYRYKYSGGLGTYCAKHIPLAAYSAASERTFFCWGGRGRDSNRLEHMVSFFDHSTGRLARPVFLLDKATDDAHDNPVLQLDSTGRVWIFSSSHGTVRPSYILRSSAAFEVESFDLVRVGNFSYPQPWYLESQGFVFLQTLYHGGRFLFSQRSEDGIHWDEPACHARIEEGHYQVSWPWRDKVGTAFNYHPAGRGLNWRTNLYYMETRDGGRSWCTVDGTALQGPLETPENPALVRDYGRDGWNVYMKDLNLDRAGRPVILVWLSRGWRPGPEDGPRVWTTAHWNGASWEFRAITESDNNYDTGCLHVEEDGAWRLIAPTEAGPQRFNPGGEVALWESRDQGRSWRLLKQLTRNSRYNHNYCRRPLHAAPGFYAFWADGNPRAPSESRLYFTDRDGARVCRLPAEVRGEFAEPEVLGAGG